MSIEFISRNRIVTQRLEQIAACDHASLLFGPSRSISEEVRVSLAAQERLLNAAERVLECCNTSRPNHGADGTEWNPGARFR